MDFNKVVWVAASLIALFLPNLQAQVEQVREIPGLCFISPQAHEAYVAARQAFEAAPSNTTYFEALKAEKLRPLTVDIKQSQSLPGAPIILDASGSTVTSGKATYLWSGFADRYPIVIVAAGTAGSTQEITLTLVDEVCGNSKVRHITVISQ